MIIPWYRQDTDDYLQVRLDGQTQYWPGNLNLQRIIAMDKLITASSGYNEAEFGE